MKKKNEFTAKDYFLFAWKYLRNFKLRLAIAISFSICYSVIEIITPIIVWKTIDYLSNNIQLNESVFTWWAYYIWLIVWIWIMYWIFRHSYLLLWHHVEWNILQKVAEDSLFRVQRFSTEWHVNSFSWSTVTKIKRWMRWLQWFVNWIVDKFLPIILVVGWIIIWVCFKNLMLWVSIAILTVIYTTIAIILATKYNMPAAREENRSDTKVWAALSDVISCNSTTKYFWNERYEDKIFKSVIDDYKIKWITSWRKFEITSIIRNIIMSIFKFTFLMWAFYLWYKWTFTVWDFSYSIWSYHLVSWYLKNIWENIRMIYTHAWEMEDIMEFSFRDFEIKDRARATELKIKKWEIEFKNISFKYEKQHEPMFENFSLKINSWEKIALVWHSGNGKTTITKLLERLYDIQTWEILIDGQDIKKIKLESLRRNIVLVPQDPILFHRTLAENIAYAKPDASKNEIEKASRLAHAHEFIMNLPDKYDTLVWERWIKLSWWERQRIAIARAILANKKILILDEATSSLDSQSEKFIQDSIKELLKKKTAIIIAHRLSTIRHADRIIVLEKWVIVEDWPHEKLLKKKNWVYRNLWEIQSDWFIK